MRNCMPSIFDQPGLWLFTGCAVADSQTCNKNHLWMRGVVYTPTDTYMMFEHVMRGGS